MAVPDGETGRAGGRLGREEPGRRREEAQPRSSKVSSRLIISLNYPGGFFSCSPMIIALDGSLIAQLRWLPVSLTPHPFRRGRGEGEHPKQNNPRKKKKKKVSTRPPAPEPMA